MITNKDLQIANISYTNKDFAQTYPELVEWAIALTNKWDPSHSDESDPGVVFLKLAAFIADKINYNIDKNALENFMLSATQATSMRRLTEMMGYNMRYYRSATTSVSFNYKNGNTAIDEILNNGGTVYLKAFGTEFKTEDNIVYTLLEDITVTKDLPLSTNKLAMQGSLKPLTVLETSNNSATQTGNRLIHLYNLDDNNRVYFPEDMVAENGIFIDRKVYDSLTNDDAWHRVDSLNDQEPGSKVFKFGFDSDKQLPYIEFPDDISDLIGEGLQIDYIVSDGLAGYVANGKLTALSKYEVTDSDGHSIPVQSFDSDTYSIYNADAVGAADPETLTEAYNNYKKIAGTFNTLVSCRDYSNAIYNLIDVGNSHLVSNVQVGDIRTDINKSHPIITRNETGLDLLKTFFDADTNPYQLLVHGTKAVNADINSVLRYNQTFQPTGQSECDLVEAALEYNKSICHQLVPVGSTDIAYIKNKYPLKVNIATTYKVNTDEQLSIISNIRKALYENFNAHEVDFGEELPYDRLVSVMENADSRIKNIILDDPVVHSEIVMGDGKVVSYDPATLNNVGRDLVIGNILAGRLPYYTIDESFNYTFNQEDIETYDKVVALKGEFTWSNPGTLYPLEANQVVQILEDSYVPKNTYVYNCYYYYSAADDVEADMTHALTEDEKLYIYYTDSSDVEQYLLYEEGDIIRPNFELKANKRGNKNIPADKFKVSNPDAEDIPMNALDVKETIEIVIKNEVTLDNKNQACFWYVKPRVQDDGEGNYSLDTLGTLYFDADGNYILEAGEFFIYPSDDMVSLAVVSEGTKLHYISNGRLTRTNTDTQIDINDLQSSISSNDVGTFEKSFAWEYKNFSTDPLTIGETLLTTAVEGESVQIVNRTAVVNSSWSAVGAGEVIKIDGDDVTLSPLSNALVRTLLLINISATNPIEIDPSTETLEVYCFNANDADTLRKITLQTHTQINPSINTYNECFLGVTTLQEEAGQILSVYEYPYSVMTYNLSNTDPAGSTIKDIILKNNLIPNANGEYIISESLLAGAADAVELGFDNTGYKVFTFAVGKNDDRSKITLKSEVHDTVSGETVNITDVKRYDGSGALYVSVPLKANINSCLLGANDQPWLDISTIIDKATAYIGSGDSQVQSFDMFASLNKSRLISSYDPIGPMGFFDKNNLYNRWVLSEIDFDKGQSEFNIVGSSKK